MNIKTIFAVILALLVGIGGTAAYFYFDRLNRAVNAPPVPPATAQTDKTVVTPSVPPASSENPSVQPIAPAKGSLKEEDLVLGGISYGASIDAVRAVHGEHREIKNKRKWHGNTAANIYEYASLFDLYEVDGIVRGIKVDHLNTVGTNKNIRVGNTVEDVLNAYGEPNIRNKDKFAYFVGNNSSLGIEFEFERGFVEEIRVGMLD